jgi:hypothetical protein
MSNDYARWEEILVRSLIMARSKLSKRPTIWIIILPVGVGVSMASVGLPQSFT